ncbi:MAG: M18 family aminopeptidase [Proteobacteria bacterium]|nr:M18 family aminopeptidase [Pseudomonadota bacterium]
MSSASFNDELLVFLGQSPTPFHAVANMSTLLHEAGFERLDETLPWQLKKQSHYYVMRNDSALVAFKTGALAVVSDGLRLAGTHTDSPCLKLKPSSEIHRHGYLQLGVEVYGGALLHPWFDRDLSLAGRVDFQTHSGELGSTLIDLREPIAFIPSLAIHLDRDVNKGRAVNPQKELSPILLQLPAGEDFSLDAFLLQHLRQQNDAEDIDKILAHELMLYDTQAATMVGLQQQFIASARLDNLLSCFLAIKALLASDDSHASVLVCNDHEEVGSVSSAGAQGPFLKAVLERMIAAEDDSSDALERVVRQSMLLSIDNAHGIHPNYADKHDEKHRPVLDGGPVIKINANQRYASNSRSVAFFKSLCAELGVPCQSFVMRNDMACGSTIGPITAAELGITTIDIGIATLGMHSIRELSGAKDPEVLCNVVTRFYNR